MAPAARGPFKSSGACGCYCGIKDVTIQLVVVAFMFITSEFNLLKLKILDAKEIFHEMLDNLDFRKTLPFKTNFNF